MPNFFVNDFVLLGGFCSGALALGMWVGGLFFWHAYKQTKDRLFVFLALSFWIMVIERTIWGLFGQGWSQDPQIALRTMIYTIRFVAFSTIAIGIIDKNTRLDAVGTG